MRLKENAHSSVTTHKYVIKWFRNLKITNCVIMQQSEKRIQQLWQSLLTVDRYHFDSFPGPGSKTAWQGSGTGTVSIQIDDNTIRFNESGQFYIANGSPLNSANVFIWERLAEGIALSHHRHDQPVYLFELIPTTEYCWSSAEDHLCGDDVYSWSSPSPSPHPVVLEINQ